MARQAALKWKERRIPASSSKALDKLTSFRPRRLDVLLDLPAAITGESDLSLPDLSAFPTPVEKAQRLLEVAAAIEHGLMVQYLYSGYGLAVPNSPVLGIAVEEMSHLMTVQNLLRVIGKGPHFERQDFGTPVSEDERLFPFDLLLEPLSKVSLAKYVVAESPKDVPTGVDTGLMKRIVDLATQGTAGLGVNRVGSLYALLGAVFGSEQLLLEKAAGGDPWYVLVNEVAAQAASEYGGRDRLHLPDATFVSTSDAAQASDAEWDRSKVGPIDEFRVHTVNSRLSALEALRDISLQGEGPSGLANEVSHFLRFYTIFKTFFGPDGAGTAPPIGVANVPRGTRIVIDEASPDPNVISNPAAARWARLADCRYALLLGFLEQHLTMPKPDRVFLQGWAFAEMFAVKKLARLLPQMQRGAAGQPLVAAMPFNLPPWHGQSPSWSDLEHVLESADREIVGIQTAGGITDEQQRILGHLASADRNKLSDIRARQTGGTTRRKLDRVREILDWGAGTGDPQHLGSSPTIPDANQGRFWNLPLNEIKQTSVFGQNVIEVPADGGDPLLVSMLRSGMMPRGRPPLPADSEEFTILEEWIRKGCPDESI